MNSINFQIYSTMRTAIELVTLIRSAWENATPPEPGNISQPTYDDEGVAGYFTGKSWQGHNAAQLRRLTHALTFFTDEAFAYYLSSYMIADIEEPEVSDVNVEGMLYRLDRYQAQSIVTMLNAKQRNALRSYIVFVKARELGMLSRECSTILSFLDEADKHD
ncbi:hypothetical protein UNDYM_3980 [Undibacterium sp. YM2]|nr:hypothetical protein UNDYM_3980 [Undibacterium sp. YM2]